RPASPRVRHPFPTRRSSDLGTSTFSTTAPPVAGPGTATASITLAANDTVTCTFTDTKRGQIVVDKVTSPSGDPTSFSFTTTGSGDPKSTRLNASHVKSPYAS